MPISSLPLDGITVVALEQAVAVPFATRQLADLGARVIKIERPGDGDFARAYDTTVQGLASHFVWLNRSKESLTLDVKRPEAREVIARLLARADVFVQNLAPGAADRLGLGTAALRAAYPRLIVCSLTGYGSTGPYATKKAYDLLVQSEVGLLSITGTPDTPSKVGVSIADIAGGMYAYSGILTALSAAIPDRTGHRARGVAVRSARRVDGVRHVLHVRRNASTQDRRQPRDDRALRTVSACAMARRSSSAFRTTANGPRSATRVLERPALADDPRFQGNRLRVQHRADMNAEIAAVFDDAPGRGDHERLDAAQIANARLNTVEQFIDHPQLAGRDAWREVASPVGPLRALVPPVRMEDVEPAMGAIPAVGEHRDAILAELGFDAGTIERWKREGMI